MSDSSYVLVSACRNESAYIDGLIDTIASQLQKPALWVIVDDGSTDDTYERAAAGIGNLPFLKVIRMPGGGTRSFASQVYAAQFGYGLLKGTPHDFIGFLDADIRLQPNYYKRVLELFLSNRELGLCGGSVIDQHDGWTENIRRGSEESHVPGGVQMFRRECFERIGGYIPIDGGGQDTVADIMTLMNGWTLRVFPELTAIHLRPEGFKKDNVFISGMKWGRKFYLLGYHPFFYLAQCLRRMGRTPILLGSICQLFGYVVAMMRQEARPVSREFVRFHRGVQKKRLLEKFGI